MMICHIFLFNEEMILIEFDNCKSVVNRIMQAYKVKKAKELAEIWGISASVIASRILRNSLPYDFVLKCFMDTNANLIWLCTGVGDPGVEGVKIENNSINLSSEDLEKLERIAALKKDGAITDDEYILLKNSIFNK